MSKKEEAIFKDALNGYGFDEVEQVMDGLYCEGCMTVHKRPTKMYKDGVRGQLWCKFAVIKFWNPEEGYQ